MCEVVWLPFLGSLELELPHKLKAAGALGQASAEAQGDLELELDPQPALS